MRGGGGAAARLRSRLSCRQLRRVARLWPISGGGRTGETRRASRARDTMSDAGGGKKPPVEPQAGPGPGPGRAAGERGLPGSFPLVLKKLMENPPRETRIGEEALPAAWGGAPAEAEPLEGGAGRSEVRVKW